MRNSDLENPVPVIRIMLAEDDDELRFILERVLFQKGYRVETITDGITFAKRLARIAALPKEEWGVDAVVSDLYMPGCSALEAIEKAKGDLSQLALIMMTSIADPEIVARARKLGVKHVLSKPFDLNELARLIKKSVEEKR